MWPACGWATEEPILNSLFMAVTTAGFGGHVRHAVPLDCVREMINVPSEQDKSGTEGYGAAPAQHNAGRDSGLLGYLTR
jgi:hypothetical protein